MDEEPGAPPPQCKDAAHPVTVNISVNYAVCSEDLCHVIVSPYQNLTFGFKNAQHCCQAWRDFFIRDYPVEDPSCQFAEEDAFCSVVQSSFIPEPQAEGPGSLWRLQRDIAALEVV